MDCILLIPYGVRFVCILNCLQLPQCGGDEGQRQDVILYPRQEDEVLTLGNYVRPQVSIDGHTLADAH